jgi:hypothetical protein
VPRRKASETTYVLWRHELVAAFVGNNARKFVHVEDVARAVGAGAAHLGFEAEHHKRALETIPGVTFYIDQKANRVGVLTTEAIKHAMCQLVVVMLRERRIHVWKPLASRDEKGMLLRLREQMEIYSYQFKLGTNTFQKDRVALSGKVGGMKDDICICLQLACYYTQLESQRSVQSLNTPVS